LEAERRDRNEPETRTGRTERFDHLRRRIEEHRRQRLNKRKPRVTAQRRNIGKLPFCQGDVDTNRPLTGCVDGFDDVMREENLVIRGELLRNAAARLDAAWSLEILSVHRLGCEPRKKFLAAPPAWRGKWLAEIVKPRAP